MQDTRHSTRASSVFQFLADHTAQHILQLLPPDIIRQCFASWTDSSQFINMSADFVNTSGLLLAQFDDSSIGSAAAGCVFRESRG